MTTDRRPVLDVVAGAYARANQRDVPDRHDYELAQVLLVELRGVGWAIVMRAHLEVSMRLTMSLTDLWMLTEGAQPVDWGKPESLAEIAADDQDLAAFRDVLSRQRDDAGPG